MADKSPSTRAKKRKVSKKSKKSWRKFTDIKDVEEHFEEARRDERTGGPASEKPDASLFFVDTKSKEPETDGTQNKRSRKRKLLKCDQLLLPDTRLKPIGSKKRKVKQSSKKKTLLVNDSSSDEDEPPPKPLVKEKSKKPRAKNKEVFDLWGKEDTPKDVNEHYLKVTGKMKVKMPKSARRKVTELTAVEVCHPGASYNPTFEDHQELLLNANEIEVKKQKENEKLERQVRFLTKDEAAALPTWEEEMGEGLFDDKSDDDKVDDDDDDDEDNEEEVMNGPILRSKQKTSQQKRKELEEKQKQKELEAEKEQKLKENDIFRIKTIKKEIASAENKMAKRRRKKEEEKKTSLQKTRKLGRHTYVNPNVEIQLSDEISGNLRKLKQEGNLMTDRFRSLQKRNIIEPRVPVLPHRKYALKEYEKRSHRKPCINEIWEENAKKKNTR
ncbi:predicted protein [Nematostella vectensis]|uniref:Ribosome biogenesis protein NOP53 n=1 Tax=Nematostella vectensis TaxID=45351 RepID=A7S812_NEMVE|nr:ribosome biogenesis protein NOP53 [Nematostella vectensis]EDO40213.1 predicted protein [Nematostella vectensis]|eukprot:XP_001632276.1 predicted protein [Nematostella vectensis]